jgi:hypothetical protein
MNPDSIKFKKTLDGVRNLYGVNDIKFFSIGDVDQYARFTVSISNAETDPNKLDYNKDTTFRTAAVFLRVLQQGAKVAMYSYTDRIKERYYIAAAPDFTPKELIFQTYLNRNYENSGDLEDHYSRTITENTFRRQLNAVAMQENELTDKLMLYIQALEYKEDDMLTIASKLNHIDKAAFEKKRNGKAPYQFLVGAGLNFTGYEPGGYYQYNAGGARYNSAFPVISGGVSLFPNPNTRRLMFRFEAALSDGNFEAYQSYSIFEASFVPQVLYNLYNGDDFKIYAGVGLSAETYSYSDSDFKTVDFTTSYHLEAGVQIGQNIAVQVQYIEDSSRARNTQIGINYVFK